MSLFDNTLVPERERLTDKVQCGYEECDEWFYPGEVGEDGYRGTVFHSGACYKAQISLNRKKRREELIAQGTSEYRDKIEKSLPMDKPVLCKWTKDGEHMFIRCAPQQKYCDDCQSKVQAERDARCRPPKKNWSPS